MSPARVWGRKGTAVLMLLAVLLSIALASPAHAHTDLVRTDPADGATLDELPVQAKLTFSGDVSAADLSVKSAGKSLPVWPVPGKPRMLAVDLRSLQPAATVSLTWKLVSSHDGHGTSGVLELKVRAAAAQAPTAAAAPAGPPALQPPAPKQAVEPAAESRTVGWLSRSARVVGYLAMAVLVGGLLFNSFLWPAGAAEPRTHRVLGLTVGVGLVAALASLADVVWRAGDDTVGAALDGVLARDFGRPYAAMVLLWLLAAVVVVALVQGGEHVVRQLAWRLGALVVAFGLIRTTGLNAHATETAEPEWGAAADFLHLSGVSAWVGGLTVLLLCLLPGRSLVDLQRVVPTFSRVALVSVLMIVASGLLLIWQIVGSVDAFWTTSYGRVLMLKISLFAVVMVAALNSKRWVDKTLAKAASSRRSGAVRAFAVSIAAESALVIAVLGAASVLTTTSPGV